MFKWNTPGEKYRTDEKPQVFVDNPKRVGPKLTFDQLFFHVDPLKIWREEYLSKYPLLSEIA